MPRGVETRDGVDNGIFSFEEWGLMSLKTGKDDSILVSEDFVQTRLIKDMKDNKQIFCQIPATADVLIVVL